MSKPALRKPKILHQSKKKHVDQKFIILTLKNKTKLVISCDAFNGIIMIGDKYKCIFCDVDMQMYTSKEQHKELFEHKKTLKNYPYIEELSENLVRPLNKINSYCTICNVMTSALSIKRHIKTDEHINELNRALMRASTYKPVDDINNNNK
ncbi:unnamed protein product [Euphydryas editha]|uniref:C2H2-type domain-containing protein n=1 Tax=Euphydryas editha TaxID=104508 RepID=A0AAU9T900_EUPED|nr:unnamed protein product [Euphydryas editha]